MQLLILWRNMNTWTLCEGGTKAAESILKNSMSLHWIQWWLFQLEKIIKRFCGRDARRKEWVLTEKWALSPHSHLPLHSDLQFPAHCSTSHHVRLFHALTPKPNPPGMYGLAKDKLTRPEAFMVMCNVTGMVYKFSRKWHLFLIS